MADLSKIKLPNGDEYNFKDEVARATGKVSGVKGNSETSYRTGDINLTPSNIGAVNKSGDTMSGTLSLKADQYYEQNNAIGLNAQNSDIVGINGLYFNDKSEDGREGINFQRSATTWDSLYVKNGIAYVSPNREINTVGEPQRLYTMPDYEVGTTDIGVRPLIARARANRLAFLPGDQVIVLKTTDGHAWSDAGYTNAQKAGTFSENGFNLTIPLLNGEKSTTCGLRVIITGMKYDVPDDALEIQKYSYWNPDHYVKTERYFNVREWWFWLSSNSDAIRVEIERSTGANPNNWISVFNSENFKMKGWSGSDWVRAGNGDTFGGGGTQTDNFWNWRLTFWSAMNAGATSFISNTAQSINMINCYGDSVWVMPNPLMRHDHLYTWDNNMNVTFPANVTATKLNGHTILSDVPANAKFTDTTYSVATTSANGLLSSADKTKLDSLGALATKNSASGTFTPAGTISQPIATTVLNTTSKYVASNATGGGSVTSGTAAACTMPTLAMTI